MRLDLTIRANVEPMRPIPTYVEPRLAKLLDVRAVAFDVYGTLLISGSGDVGLTASSQREQSFAQASNAVGLGEVSSEQAVIARLEQVIRDVHQMARYAGNEHPEVDIVEVWKSTLASLLDDSRDVLRTWERDDWEVFSTEFEMRVNPVWPMPGVLPTLKWLRERSKLLGIVSNAQFFTPRILASLLGQSLDNLGFRSKLNYFSYEHLHAKPGTFLYEALRDSLEELGIPANQALYVGNDMLNDVMAAANVGFRTALFAGDQRSLRWREGDARVRNVEPDIVITELQQLTDCVM